MSASKNEEFTTKRSFLKNWGLPIIVLALVVSSQWPMLKGAYYKNLGGETTTQVGFTWETDFDKAQAESAATGKPILIDFSAQWCPPCQVMKHEVWPNAAVGQAVEEGFIPVLIDIDIPENQRLAQKYGVSSIPRIFVVNSQGEIQKQTGYMTVSQMLEFLPQASQQL